MYGNDCRCQYLHTVFVVLCRHIGLTRMRVCTCVCGCVLSTAVQGVAAHVYVRSPHVLYTLLLLY